jgi:hypothetical protein
LRAAAAKGMAIGAIAGTFVAAAILIVWPERTQAPDPPAMDADRPAPLITSRPLPIDFVEGPRARRAARGSSTTAPPPMVVQIVAPATTEPAARSQAAPAIGEEPLLSSRSVALASELMPVSSVSVSVETDESSRRGGVLTRAMGTTAGAFRTAGTSVAGALKKVF